MRFFISLLVLATLAHCAPSPEDMEIVLPNSLEPGEGEELAQGYVYHDLNENRTKDSNEPGIAGVFVSNGTELVQTDAEGKYSIPVDDDAIIFVIKPRDWMTPVNELNLPQFYYLHKPNGYPENFTFEGVAPTGPLPESIDFPLYIETGSNKFKMVVFGDPQPYSLEQVDFLAEDVITELVDAQGLEFGMTMGDIVGDDLDLFSPLNQAVSKIGIPWYNVLGNHDVNFQAPSDELSDETFERVFGPANYAFVYGDVHFIVVDNVIMNEPVGDRGYVGGLRPDQIEFVSNYLNVVPKEDLIVLTMHIPLAQHERFRQSDQKELFDLLK
ncbi:MAG: metallophosphoesterase, partial [Balneolales bacterium]|nr:metallophosphoesterase [Balneolales bacterium]